MDKYDRAFNADWDEYKQLRTFIGDRYNGFIDLLKEKYHIEIPENLQGDYPQPSDLGLFIADKYGLSKDKDEDYNRLYGMRFLAKIGKDLKEDNFFEGLEDKLEIVKENLPEIMKYLQKEFPTHSFLRLYTDTQDFNDRRIAALSIDVAESVCAQENSKTSKSEKISKGIDYLAEIGETAFWTREKYANNFLAVLKYLEKNDGLDVSEVRDAYLREVEKKQNDPFYARLDPWHAKEPDPSVEKELHKIVEKKFANLDEGEFANSKENIYHQTMKYYRVTALKAVLDQQKQMTQARSGYTK
ncbi:MAG: hypothetical protein IJ870_01640 [Alphaproteobacteria bacterium]|nr:hypothetical protein [Alphaproteobacteria bacterium]